MIAEIADPQRVRIGERQCGEVTAGNLDHRHVAFPVGADDLGVELTPVAQGHGDRIDTIDDVVVGDDIATASVDHDSGTDALRLAFERLLGNVEKTAKEGIIQQRVTCQSAFGSDVDYCRGRLFQHRRQGRQCLAVHGGR